MQTMNMLMAKQENISRELFEMIFQDDNIHILFRTHEWDIVNIIYMWKIQGALKSTLSPKCIGNVFWS